jgi:hypothetical protein
MEYNVHNFWNADSFSDPTLYSNMFERLKETSVFSQAQRLISNPIQRAMGADLTFFDVLMGKKIDSQDRVISQQERLEEQLDNLQNGMINENLDDEVQAVKQEIDNEAKIKFLQLYFDSYMAPLQSDSNWRLGPVTGTMLETDATDLNLGIVNRGEMYTRSNFAIPFYRQLWSAGEAIDKLEYYASFFFPPYKIGVDSKLGEETSYMKDVLRINPEASFNQDTFKIKKEGYTYREAGFKSINDHIHFLQWVAEGMTGVVSTYLTEWDLSIYMQEHLMTATVNGGPLKLFLNYRVRNDNPMADEKGNYTDDRALVFNVAGSAVSKIDFDCQKMWRPSDYPLSQWWLPYKQDVDWRMAMYSRHDAEYDFDMPYMDIYDNIRSDFAYEAKSMRDIMRQQDFLGAMLGTWPDINLKYYHTFYYTDMDSLTDFEIKVQSWLKKVSGADAGKSTQMKKAMNNFIEKAREEMLLNGGYYGSPTPPGLSGGYMGRMMMQSTISGSDDKMTGGKMSSASKSGANNALEETEVTQLDTKEDTAQQTLNEGLSNKADASNMCKFTGINRFSPALFGGPHGRDFSPNTIQGYFDVDSMILRNIPRVTHNNSSYFTTEDDDDKFTDLNKFYDDGGYHGISPNKALSYMVRGLTNYRISYGYYRALRTSWIDGTIEYDYATRNFTKYVMPSHTNQNEIYQYKGNYRFTSRTYVRTTNPWTQRNWWYTYLSYFNTFSISWYTRRGNVYKFTTIAYIVQRLAAYYYTGLNPYKTYTFDDMPDVKWQIVQHRFESFSDDAGPFWNWMLQQKGRPYLQERFPEKFKTKTVFVLKFPNQANEAIFRRKIMKGQNSGTAFFLQGNNGPTSLFRATVNENSYTNVIVNKFTVKLLFLKFTVTSYQYTKTKFLQVDMLNSGFFLDNLQNEPWSNRFHTGVDVPMHLKSYQNTKKPTIYSFHALTRAQPVVADVMISTKHTQEKTVNGLFAIAGLLIGGPMLALAGAALAGKLAQMGMKDGVNWVSTSKMGILGQGIIENIQGLNPQAVDPPGLGTSFRSKLAMPEWAKDVAIKSLPLMFDNASQEASPEMKYAMANLYTRATFISEQMNNAIPGFFVSIDVPIRNFLSILLTQVSFFKFAKNILIDPIDFEVLHQALLNCVDKCVIKANGLTKDDVKVKADKEHVLYNYWIEQAIYFFGDKSTYNTTKDQLRSEFNRKINKFDYTISKLTPICEKHVMDWTFNEICLCYDLIYTMKEEAEKGLIDRFMFAYLNVLYNYRFYFVARRFNKENGTMWIMRALESVLDFIVPFAEDMPPPPLAKLGKKLPVYKVVFYELSNPTNLKLEAIQDGLILEEDRISVVYTKVQWVNKKEYDKWLAYQEDPNNISEVPEVIEIVHDDVTKYAYKPTDGTYQLTSQELTTNDKNAKWNKLHEQEPQRFLDEIDVAIWNIAWGNSPDLTPIRWNVFGSVNINNLLEYSKASVSPEELICLMEEGADFWTITVPKSVQPRKSGYKTKIKLKIYREKETAINVKNDVMFTMLGPMAYSVYPITNKQERPIPGIAAEIPEIYQKMNSGVDGYGV